MKDMNSNNLENSDISDANPESAVSLSSGKIVVLLCIGTSSECCAGVVTNPGKHFGSASTLSRVYCQYLEQIKDNWSSCHAAKLLASDLIAYIVPRFQDTSSPLKVRILTSFLYIKDELRTACRRDLLEILMFAETDANEWVRKLGRMLIPYVNLGVIDLENTDSETAFRIINFLDEQQRLNSFSGKYHRKPGLEAPHICDPHAEIRYIATEFNVKPEKPLPMDEYKLYMARENFESLLSQIVKDGQEEMWQQYLEAETSMKDGSSSRYGVRDKFGNFSRIGCKGVGPFAAANSNHRL